MKKSDTIDTIYVLGIFAGFVLYYGGITQMNFWLILLCFRLFLCNRVETGFFLLIFGSSMFGRIFVSPSLYTWSMIVSIVAGSMLLYKEIAYALSKNGRSFFYLFLILLFFLFVYFVGPQTDYANDKLTRLLVRAPLWTVAFLIYVYSNKISNASMAINFALLALFYLSQSAQLFGIHPTSIFDVSFFRVQAELLGRDDNGTLDVNWQTLGFLSLASIMFFLADSKFTRKKIFLVLFVLMGFCVILAGARQVIMCLIVLCVLRFYLGKKHGLTPSNLIKIAAILGLFYFTLSALETAFVKETIGGDGDMSTALNRDTDTPFEVMDIDPVFGIGFGGYPLYANKDYPHNIFLEMICETGIVGTIIFFSIFFAFLYTNKVKSYFHYKTLGDSYIFIFIAMRFLISLISGDVGSNVCFMCITFACVPINMLRFNTISYRRNI